MKKSVMIIIGIIYVASIVVINFFGMKVFVYNKTIDVEQIVCLNKTDEEKGIVVSTFESYNGETGTAITIKFDKPANKNLMTGTMLQLDLRVLPDNATKKELSFTSTASDEEVEFFTDESGKQTGLMLFYESTSIFEVFVKSTDNSNVTLRLKIWAKA